MDYSIKNVVSNRGLSNLKCVRLRD